MKKLCIAFWLAFICSQTDITLEKHQKAKAEGEKMNTETLMLYLIILINQAVSYGALIYLATMGGKVKSNRACECKVAQPTVAKVKEQSRKNQKAVEENVEGKGAYLDYINNFEVQA